MYAKVFRVFHCWVLLSETVWKQLSGQEQGTE